MTRITGTIGKVNRETWHAHYHPRTALGSDVTVCKNYGQPAYYYIRTPGTYSALATDSTAASTLDDAIKAGVATMQAAAYSLEASQKLSKLTASLSATAADRFEQLFTAWQATWSRPELAKYSNPAEFGKSAEYSTLYAYCLGQGKSVWPLMFQKLATAGPITIVLMQALVSPTQANAIAVVRDAPASLSADGKTVVTTMQSRWLAIAERILQSM